MTVVLDASAAFAHMDGQIDVSEEMSAHEHCFVPILFQYELAQILFHKYNRTASEHAASQQLALPQWTDFSAVQQLVQKRGLTAYDASYLELAARKNATLLTLDKKLRKAALAEGLEAPEL